MFTVALIGPDGSGKSTIGRRLESELPLPSKYIYMGVNLESSNLVLPTTRLILEIKKLRGGRPDMAGAHDPGKKTVRAKSAWKRALQDVKSIVRIFNLIAEEWYRQSIVEKYLRRGTILLCDRHFFPEYWQADIAPSDEKRPIARRIHGWVLRRFPRPDLVICLDAPAEVLFARKREGTIEFLERRRRQYLDLEGVVDCFVRVDVSQPVDDVVRETAGVIADFHANKSGKPSVPETAGQPS